MIFINADRTKYIRLNMCMITDLTFNQKALMFAVIAKGAYLDDSSAIFAAYNLFNYQFMSNNNAYGHIAFNDTDLVISFRGSSPENISNWLTDINILPETYSSGKVHMGFKQENDKLMPQVLNAINIAPKRNVWICGHSLGGAMTTIAIAELLKAKLCTPIAFTYGEPRSGDSDFVTELVFEHHRFVNCNDIVPTVPPLAFGYIHHGLLHYLTYTGNIVTSPSMLLRIRDQFLGRINAWKNGEIFDVIYDHNTSLYVQKIQQFGLTNA